MSKKIAEEAIPALYEYCKMLDSRILCLESQNEALRTILSRANVDFEKEFNHLFERIHSLKEPDPSLTKLNDER